MVSKKEDLILGLQLLFPLVKRIGFSVNLELLFSQKGSYEKMGPSDTTGEPQPYYELRLDYVEVPVFRPLYR